jgi:hypothetical protein
MLALFTARYHLADATTRAFYPVFLQYVEIWNMWLKSLYQDDVPTKPRPQ